MPVLLSKPPSIWQTRLKVDIRNTTTTAVQAAVACAKQDWGKAFEKAVEALTGVGFQKKRGELAWGLVWRSAVRAVIRLHTDNKEFTPQLGKVEAAPWMEAFADALNGQHLDLETFFARPGDNTSVMRKLNEAYADWLSNVQDLQASQRTALRSRFTSSFVCEVHAEWIEREQYYEPLLHTPGNPFDSAVAMERAWVRYGAELDRRLDMPMWAGGGLSLRQLYVPLRGSVVPRERVIAPAKTMPSRCRVVDLKSEIQTWLMNGLEREPVRFVAGGPGSGKSSFSHMLAADLARVGITRVLLIPLNHFDMTSGLEEGVGRFVKQDGIFPENPVTSPSRPHPLLIIFDGLDELDNTGGDYASRPVARLLMELRNEAKAHHRQGRQLGFVVTGRDIVIQNHVADSLGGDQILHVLPYYVAFEKRHEYEDPKQLLAIDQRQDWWRKFFSASSSAGGRMPPELAEEQWVEITAQPLLNHLLALCVTGQNGPNVQNNRNAVYAYLIDEICARPWAEERNIHLDGLGISAGECVQFLEEVALAAWHSHGLGATTKEIELQCRADGRSLLFEKIQEAARNGIPRLLQAFYFRLAGNTAVDQTPAYEFTHASFREYLTSRRMTTVLRTLSDGMHMQGRPSGFFRLSPNLALQTWAQLCGPAAVDDYLLRFLCDEIHFDSKVAKPMKETCARLISEALESDFPMDALTGLTFSEKIRQARNAGEALLALHYACTGECRKVSAISRPSPTAFSAWLAWLRGQRASVERNGTALQCLCCLNLSNVTLDAADLIRANLCGTDLNNSSLRYASLAWANLKNVNLLNARLDNSNLSGADLTGADLKKASFRMANLKGAILNDTQIKGAVFSGADLRGAWLKGVNFTPNAEEFKGADLRDIHT